MHRYLPLLLLLASCGIYSFRGTTVPPHLKRVEIPLFINQSSVPQAAEELTDVINDRVGRERLLTVSHGGDAVLTGTLRSYSSEALDFRGERDNVELKSSRVEIEVHVEFFDRVRETMIYNGTVRGTGLYNFSTESEQEGRTRAIEDAAEKIINNLFPGW